MNQKTTATCMIIDDSLFIREIYKNCLINTEIEIIGEAGDGTEAVSKLNLLNPDIALLDLVLPDKNGFDILSECANLKTKFIVISSMPADEFQKKATHLGAVFYLEKPFKKLDLVRMVEIAMKPQSEVSHG
jgi:YesN/AraC family two-component response regulator